MVKKKDWWLVFNDAEFTKGDEGCDVWTPLNITVHYDNYGSNQTETIITFDTVGFGGNHIQTEVVDDKKQSIAMHSGHVTLTLYGQWEANAFFSALRNLLKCYDMRAKLA